MLRSRVVRAVMALFAATAIAAAPLPVARFSDFRYAGTEPAYAGLPASRGTYLNPIIAGSYADPSIVRVGRDFYLTNSSFALFPGLPIFQSRDLVHWRQIGSAITRTTQMSFAGRDTWEGIYAPDLKYHDGRFYLLSTCYNCGGNFLLSAKNPAGPWSDPIWLPFQGIDPSLFVDRDSVAYVVNNGPPPGSPRYDGHRAIWLQRIDLATGKMIGERGVIVDGGTDIAAKPFWIEGPHLFRRGDFYYLICAEGGTKEAHREVAFRAHDVRGPYVAAPAPILSQLGLDPKRPYPIVQAGHADFVTTPKGDWWAVFLASRPYGPGELDYNSGRETFLMPVSWRDDWPSVLPSGVAIPYRAPAPALPRLPQPGVPTGGDYIFTDAFRGPTLDPRWSWVRTPVEGWRAVGGVLTLPASSDGLGKRGKVAFVGVRQAHRRMNVEVTVRFAPAAAGDAAGLALFQDERRHFTLGVTRAADEAPTLRLARRTGPTDPADGLTRASIRLRRPGAPVRLRIAVDGAVARFSYALGNTGWRPIGGAEDASLLSIGKAGGFTGTLVGPYAAAGARAVYDQPASILTIVGTVNDGRWGSRSRGLLLPR